MWRPDDFDSELALKLADLIDRAYTQFEDVEKKEVWQLAAPYQLLEQFYYTEWEKPLLFGRTNRTYPFGFMATQGNDLYIVFRGTATPLEWLRDAQLKQVDFLKDGGKTTWGFGKIYTALSSMIFKKLETLNPSRVFVTGHSLGGALANLCAVELLSQTSWRPILYTFGCPRTGDPAFARSFERYSVPCCRIVNTEDIVTTVPVSTLKLEHLGELLVVEIGLIALTKLLGGIPEEVFEHIGESISFTTNQGNLGDNHAMTTYIEGLKQFSPLPVLQSS